MSEDKSANRRGKFIKHKFPDVIASPGLDTAAVVEQDAVHNAPRPFRVETRRLLDHYSNNNVYLNFFNRYSSTGPSIQPALGSARSSKFSLPMKASNAWRVASSYIPSVGV